MGNRIAKHVLTSAGEEESATFFKLEMKKLTYKVEKRHLMAINFKLR
jgi:hypothetical protein